MARRKRTTRFDTAKRFDIAQLGALPMFGIGAGALWLLYQTLRARGGKEWRGYTGTVVLKPAVVYRFEFVAPLKATSPARDMTVFENQQTIEQTLESRGARNFLWNAVPDGMHLYFDQSFQEPSTITFGKSGLGPLTALTAHRVDGLDWDSP